MTLINVESNLTLNKTREYSEAPNSAELQNHGS